MLDEDLHKLARKVATTLKEPDKKQLRFNDIVEVAKEFYNDPFEGVRELVVSCDKADTYSYVKGNPWWKELKENGRWMIT